MPTNEGEKLLHSKKNAAQLISVCTRTVDNLIAAKKLKTVRIGRRCLIRHADLLRFIQRGTETTSKPALDRV